jgi:hypothetical protein
LQLTLLYVGLKRALLFGLSLYCIYQSFFLIVVLSGGSSATEDGSSPFDSLILFGAALGGSASGILWFVLDAAFALSLL